MYRNADGDREGKVHNKDVTGETRRVRKTGTKSALVQQAAKLRAAQDRKNQSR